jgi:hypothetical protein
MSNFGMNFGFLAVSLVNILIIVAWLILAVYALLQLRKLDLPPVAKAVWALLIVAVPVLGAVAFLIVKPE